MTDQPKAAAALVEPVTVAQVKEQCRIIDSDSDALLERYIPAARAFVENYTRHVLVQRAFTEYRTGFEDYIALYRVPVISVASVGYLDEAGASVDYTGFVASLGVTPARIYPAVGGAWPSIAVGSQIAVDFIAGYDAGAEPPEALHAITLLVAHWFNQREPVNTQMPGAGISEIPLTVSALCDQIRMPWA